MQRIYTTGLVALITSMALLAACRAPAVIPPTLTAPPATPTVAATPTAAVATPFPAPPTALPAATPAAGAAQTLSPDDQAAAAHIKAYLEDQAARGAFGGAVLVARNGVPLVSQGVGFSDRAHALPNTPQTHFRIASLTKQFTALAVLLLQARGLLDVGDPICQYLPECPSAWAPITIHHLLTHTSGIPELTRFPDFEATKATPSPLPATVARFRDRPLDFAPGSRWDYSNSNYILLGYLIEQLTGQTYAAFVHDNIFAPLGMRDSGYEDISAVLVVGYVDSGDRPADVIDLSIPHAAGALYSSVEDLLRWDQALYTEQLAPAADIARLFTPYAPIPGPEGLAYGYGWVVGEEFGRPVAMHSGGIEGFSANIRRYPDDRVTVIVLSNQQDVNPNATGQEIARLLFAPQP